MRQISETVKHLLIINALFFLATLSLGPIVYDWFSLHYFKSPKFQLWQPLTHMFMHGDFSHIFFNMFGLYMFGTPLEQMWGRNKFIFFYLSTGFGAALLQMCLYHYQVQEGIQVLQTLGLGSAEIKQFLESSALAPGVIEQADIGILRSAYQAFSAVLVGASGALYGVLVGFAMLFPNAQLMLLFPPIPIKAKYLVPILILVDLFFGFSSYSMGPIAHFAHVGGALTGLVMMWYWKRNQFNNNRWN
ncbi:MAG: rhomboid family intramembrane serine protease [Flavobacteriaceae bacterium TMED120]|jgi:membrane associated rhomboid family serine protease|nr:MAG: rhomboid family intramembrane serine protease [Flavobacteriaceae bacterium TMED120]CAI8209257.1 MAG: Rhomboid protease GlpG [Flavobacteriaceae bacterium]|tara:strand:- start:9222 stop:9959 length:738 start_codon:yes stop_codon:yes gene_type:complete